MIRNTRSLVQVDLPPRYAQTVIAHPAGEEADLYCRLEAYLRYLGFQKEATTNQQDTLAQDARIAEKQPLLAVGPAPSSVASEPCCIRNHGSFAAANKLTSRQLSALLSAQGSHPAALRSALLRYSGEDARARDLVDRAEIISRSAKDEKLLELLDQSRRHKILIFVNFVRTLFRLEALLGQAGIPFSTFSGMKSPQEKKSAVTAFRDEVPVMLCTESAGEGCNLQFADTLVNYDLPWNPMKIEQRIGRIHRIGQTRQVFVFSLCTAGSLEDRILHLLNDKIRMFELVVGEVGSILGNLKDGEQFESIILNLWLESRDAQSLDRSFEALGDSLLAAQEQYLSAKALDEALFGEDYE